MLPHNGGERIKVELTPVRGTPAKEFAERLKGLTWPDEDFAGDLEAIQSSQPEGEDLMGIWKGSGPDDEVEEFLDWRRGEARREAKEFEQ